MFKLIVAFAVVIVVALLGLSMIEGAGGDTITASAQLIAPQTDLAGYARAIGPYDWRFPRDFGAHDTFQTEWWYYTGNLATDDGRRFGYQFTIFRRAIAPENSASASEFRTNQVYMAHFTVSDIADQRFYHEQRFSRGAAGLAFALPDDDQPDVPYHVALDNWQIRAGSAPDVTMITAQADGFAIDFTLTDVKGVALQGHGGLSPKSGEPGNASYYYSQPRQATAGTITLGSDTFTVSGASWKDHEFSTSALGSGRAGMGLVRLAVR
ncbi:MAG: carotenoid 1,2-hydratase [Chloroflexi bacterium]|nr:carotenoid 1,2-hydratase [Chloroflexota bacterium]